MQKIKVSKKMFEALEKGIQASGKENFLKSHSERGKWTLDVYLPLNQLSIFELAEILIKGYEVEETPEEKLLNIYKNSKENYPNEIKFRNGIAVALNVLNINIKGIND